MNNNSQHVYKIINMFFCLNNKDNLHLDCSFFKFRKMIEKQESTIVIEIENLYEKVSTEYEFSIANIDKYNRMIVWKDNLLMINKDWMNCHIYVISNVFL